MSEAPTNNPRPPVRRSDGRALSTTAVTEEELAHLDFSSWKADQWLEDAVELEMRFGIGPGVGPIDTVPAPRPILYRVMEWLLVCNLTLVVVMILLYGKGDGKPAHATPSQHQPWELAFAAAKQGEPSRAVEILERYLETHPSLSDFERGLTYNLLAFFLVRDGRFEEAGDFERQSHAIVSRSGVESRQWASGTTGLRVAPAPK